MIYIFLYCLLICGLLAWGGYSLDLMQKGEPAK